MNADARDNPWSRLVTGLIILAVGLIFWLDQIDRLNARDYFDWWPVALIAIGLGHLAERRWVAALIWIGIGTVFLMPLFGYERPNIWLIFAIWPLMISIAGVTLIGQAVRTRDHAAKGGFQAVAVMAGNERRLAAPVWGGSAVAIMGGCEIDIAAEAMRESEKEIVLEVLAFWGGIEIRIPAGWNVVNRVAPILGSLQDKTVPAADGAPRLIVRGSAIMGSVEVRNSMETAA